MKNKLLKVLLFSTSLVCFVLSILLKHFAFSIASIPFLAFVFELFHELGHVFGCLLVKTKVNYVEFFGFLWSRESGLSITNRLTLFGKVNFNKTEKCKLVYLMGIVFSLVFSCLALLLYFLQAIDFIQLCAILFCLLIVFLPLKNADICRLFERK